MGWFRLYNDQIFIQISAILGDRFDRRAQTIEPRNVERKTLIYRRCFARVLTLRFTKGLSIFFAVHKK